jgi:long-chain fatty acid transport protein
MRASKIIAIAVAAFPALAHASGFEVINTSPRDLSLSGSAVAAQRDAAATYQNPAALSRLEGFNLSLGASLLSLSTTWTAPSGGDSGLTGDSTTEFAPTPPVAVFAAYGTKLAGKGFGVGFGVGTPGGGQMHWEDDWQGRGRIITVERRILGFYLNAGYELTNWLRVGGGAIYYYGIQYLKQGVEPFTDPAAYGELSTNGGGFSFQLSTELQPIESLRIGVDFKYEATISMEGDGHFVVPASIAGASTQDQGVSQDLPFPMLIAVGASWQVSKPVLVTLQFNYSGFHIYEEDLFVGDKGLELKVPRDYDDGYVIRGGVEWAVSPEFELRFGLMHDFSGLNTDTLSPTLPDSDTNGISTGFSWKFNPKTAIHAAFFYGDRLKQTATGTTAFPGSYKTEAWIAALGFTWRT